MKILSKNKSSVFAFALVFLATMTLVNLSYASPETFAYPSNQSIFLMENGTPSQVTKKLPVYKINQNNYMKIRDIGAIVDFQVEYDNAKKAVSIITNQHSDGKQVSTMEAHMMVSAIPSAQALYIDGKKVENLSMYAIDGNNYLKLRDVAKAVNFGCVYDSSLKAVVLSKFVTYTTNNTLADGTPRKIIYTNGVQEQLSEPKDASTPKDKKYPGPREDYLQKYAAASVQQRFADGVLDKDQFNCAVQSLIDRQKIYDSIGVLPRDVTEENCYNPDFDYAYYPIRHALKDPFTGAPGSMLYPQEMETKRDDCGYFVSAIGCYTVIPGTMETKLRANYPELVTAVENCVTTREKVRVMVKAVCARLEYSTEDDVDFYSDIWDTRGGILNTACGGYAVAFERLCRTFDIPYVSFIGKGSSGASHVWDAVYLVEESKWVIIDSSGAEVSFDKYVCVDVSSYPYMHGNSVLTYGTPQDIACEAVRLGYELRS